MSLLTFDISLHPRPPGTAPGDSYRDDLGLWPTLVVPRDAAGEPLMIGFDEALDRLAGLDRLYVEPDGSFVWVGPGGEGRWQVDGNAYERHGRVLNVDVKGQCPAADWERFLRAWGWPMADLIVQLVRAGVFVDEPTFRRRALARGAAPGE